MTSSFTTCLESAVLTLANQYEAKTKEYEAKTLSEQDVLSNKLSDALSAAQVAQILIDLPCDKNIRRLLNTVEDHYSPFFIEMLQEWCTLRQALDQQARESEIAEKETVPPLALDNKTHTAIPECRPDSFAYRSPQKVLTTPRSDASPASPLLHPGSHTAISADASLLEPLPSDSSFVVPKSAARPIFSVNPPSGGDVVAAPFGEVVLERDEEEAQGLTLDVVVPQDTLGFPATPDEENQIAKATLSTPSCSLSTV